MCYLVSNIIWSINWFVAQLCNRLCEDRAVHCRPE